jgi:hypothetical protein
MADDKVISIGHARAKDFSEQAEKNRPILMICIDAEGEPRLTLGKTTWRELAYALFTLDQHLARDFWRPPDG